MGRPIPEQPCCPQCGSTKFEELYLFPALPSEGSVWKCSNGHVFESLSWKPIRITSPRPLPKGWAKR